MQTCAHLKQRKCHDLGWYQSYRLPYGFWEQNRNHWKYHLKLKAKIVGGLFKVFIFVFFSLFLVFFWLLRVERSLMFRSYSLLPDTFCTFISTVHIQFFFKLDKNVNKHLLFLRSITRRRCRCPCRRRRSRYVCIHVLPLFFSFSFFIIITCTEWKISCRCLFFQLIFILLFSYIWRQFNVIVAMLLGYRMTGAMFLGHSLCLFAFGHLNAARFRSFVVSFDFQCTKERVTRTSQVWCFT